MKELWVRKDSVIKRIHENIASEYKNIGWEVISEEEAKKGSKPEIKSIISVKKEEKSEE